MNREAHSVKVDSFRQTEFFWFKWENKIKFTGHTQARLSITYLYGGRWYNYSIFQIAYRVVTQKHRIETRQGQGHDHKDVNLTREIYTEPTILVTRGKRSKKNLQVTVKKKLQAMTPSLEATDAVH